MVDIICYMYKDKHYNITIWWLYFVMYKLVKQDVDERLPLGYQPCISTKTRR